MSIKNLFLLMILFIVLGSIAFFDPFQFKEKKELKHAQEAHVFWFKDKKIAQIEISNAKMKINISCADEPGCTFDRNANWKISSPISDAGDSTNIGSFTSSLLNLNIVEKMDFPSAPDSKEFGFDHPFARLKIDIKGESAPYELIFGNENPVAPHRFAYSPSYPNRVFLISNYFPNSLEKDLFYWRNKRIFPVVEANEISQISWVAKGKKLAFEKKEGKWFMNEPYATRANDIMLEGLVSTIAYASVQNILPPKEKLSSSPFLKFNFKTKDSYSLSLYKKDLHQLVGEMGGVLYVFDAVPFDRFLKDISEYRQRTLITLSESGKVNVLEFQFQREKKKASFVKKGNEWEQVEGEKIDKISQNRLNDLFQSLSSSIPRFSNSEYREFQQQKKNADLELIVSGSQGIEKKFSFVILNRKHLITSGEIPNEVRMMDKTFAQILPIRYADLAENSYKRVTNIEADPEGEHKEFQNEHHHHH